MLVRTTGCQYCTEVACVVTVQQLQLSRKIHARKRTKKMIQKFMQYNAKKKSVVDSR